MRRRSNTTVLPSAGSASKSSYPRRRCQPDKMTAIEALHRGYDRRLTGPPLRRSSVCIGICAALVVLLTFATFVHLSLLANMRLDVAGVFYTALALSSLIAIVPVAILWFLDRRERENPWLFAAAFLWGGLIATGLALPFNTAFFVLVTTDGSAVRSCRVRVPLRGARGPWQHGPAQRPRRSEL
jgi:hypothetical protein